MATPTKTLLRIDSSSRPTGSWSRSVGDEFTTAWRSAHGAESVRIRDLAAQPLPHISVDTISAFFTPPADLSASLKEASALSDALIGEIEAADALLITVPMYNFGVPSALKAWIDQIVRIGRTFSFDGTQFQGLLNGKPAYVICAYGAAGYLPGGGFAAANFVEPYLRFVLEFLGMKTTFLSVQSTSIDAGAAERDAEEARRAVRALA